MSRTRSYLANAALAIGAPLVVLVWVEGCSSVVISLRGAVELRDGPGVRRHDEELGWVSLPSLSVPDVWGAGRDLHTNARGFRGREEVADAVPAGRIRVACSGDSFAFGDGVADEDTWCHHLSLLDPRIEAVNLGQSGYGVDQAFLRFRRDARDLELDAHLLSFIGPDLTRAGRSSFHGFAKPVFRLEGGELVLEGVPVPERGPALRRVALGWLERLRSSEFVRRGRKKLFGRRHPPMRERIERVGPVVARLFEELHRESTERGVQTVFVYLPLSSEIEEDGPWRGWVQEYFAGSPLPLVDLTDALRAAPEAEARGYYLRDEVPAGGHLSEQGNAWAAHQLYEALRPRIDRLASDGS